MGWPALQLKVAPNAGRLASVPLLRHRPGARMSAVRRRAASFGDSCCAHNGPGAEEALLLCRLGLRLLRGVCGPGQFQAGDVGQVLFLGERAVDLGTLHAREVVGAVPRPRDCRAGSRRSCRPESTSCAAHPGIDQRALGIDRTGQFMADQTTEAAELVGGVGLGVEHRALQDRGGDDQAVLRQVIGSDGCCGSTSQRRSALPLPMRFISSRWRQVDAISILPPNEPRPIGCTL